MISKEEFIKLVTQADAVALFDGMFDLVLETPSTQAIGIHPALPPTVTSPKAAHLRNIFHIRLPANPEGNAEETRSKKLAQELNNTAKNQSWLHQIRAIMFSGTDTNIYFVIPGEEMFVLPLGGDTSEREEELTVVYEQFITQFQHGYTFSAFKLGELLQQLTVICPAPAGWKLEPGWVTSNLTPDLLARVGLSGSHLWYEIRCGSCCESGPSDLQTLPEDLSKALGIVLYKQVSKMPKKKQEANLSAIPAWALTNVKMTLHNEKAILAQKTLDAKKKLLLAEKAEQRLLDASVRLDTITALVEGTS